MRAREARTLVKGQHVWLAPSPGYRIGPFTVLRRVDGAGSGYPHFVVCDAEGKETEHSFWWLALSDS